MGFLPLKAERGDKIFIAGTLFVAIHLLWMRYVENYIPLYGAFVLSIILGVIIIKWG